jgi:hypothetical protein
VLDAESSFGESSLFLLASPLKVFAAPKLREKREETESDDSQKLVCVGAEWLRDFAGNDHTCQALTAYFECHNL